MTWGDDVVSRAPSTGECELELAAYGDEICMSDVGHYDLAPVRDRKVMQPPTDPVSVLLRRGNGIGAAASEHYP